MSADTPTISAAKSPRLSPPELRVARFEDYPQIRRLESSHGLDTREPQDWQSLWLNNPLWPRLEKDWPIGWVLHEADGRIIGSITSVPSLYRFRRRELICANGRAWVVEGQYRAFAQWLMDEYFNHPKADLFVNTTVGPEAVQTLSALSTRVPVGDWQMLAYWVTAYRPFMHKALQKMNVPLAGLAAIPAAAALWLRDGLFAKSLPDAPLDVEIAIADSFDSRFDAFWEDLLRQNPDKLLAARDSRSLSWHFSLPMRRGRVWIFTASRGGLMRAYCVLKRQDQPQGMRRMRLVDYQTVERDRDLLPALLESALERCTKEKMCVLEHLGCELLKMRSFDDYAPHRHSFENWPFYYKAADAGLNAELGRPEVWDPSSYDGDASFE